jgi:very-short-patch-repair endonuclease
VEKGEEDGGNTEREEKKRLEVVQWVIELGLRAKMLQRAQDFRKKPTRSEDLLWQELRGRKLDGRKFRRQQPIGPFIVDFFCAEERLVVEVDGPIHLLQQERDQQRQQLLESLGLRFVRVSSDAVETNLPLVLTIISDSWSLIPPTPFSNYVEKGEEELPSS